MKASGFPGGSKTKVSKAGGRVRAGTETADDWNTIEEWRASHRSVLNTFQAILRIRARGRNIIVAQRHKRLRTIVGKLARYPKMELARMDDIAGCRLIFESIDQLRSFRTEVHSARFKHRRRNADDKYDYIKKPKKTGYRGIHDVYSYDVNSAVGARLKGLYIEIQYRTLVQHAWATAVEVIGFVTSSQPKFQAGDRRYEDAMALASEILARTCEDMSGPLPALTDRELVKQFAKMDEQLGLLRLLRGLNTADGELSQKRNMILVYTEADELEVRSYRSAPDALRALFEIERERPGVDVVLVKADTSDQVRLAFKNYFSDARDFIRLVEEGCEVLAGAKALDSAARILGRGRP